MKAKPKIKLNMKTPKNKCWIVAIGNDDFKYHPKLILISKVKKYNKENKKDQFKMYRREETVQRICDKGNSM